MLCTVVETPTFQKQAETLWSEDEHLDFIEWIASHPLAGDLIPGAEGARKVRWGRAGQGKSGGLRIIYFTLDEHKRIVLLTVYAKSQKTNMLPSAIRKGR